MRNLALMAPRQSDQRHAPSTETAGLRIGASVWDEVVILGVVTVLFFGLKARARSFVQSVKSLGEQAQPADHGVLLPRWNVPNQRLAFFIAASVDP